MLKLLSYRPEYFTLVMNLLVLARYVYLRQEPGKILYWLGACILTLGLIRMKG